MVRMALPSLVLSSLPCEQHAVRSDESSMDVIVMSCRLLHVDVYAWFSFTQLDHSGLLRLAIACDGMAVASSVRADKQASR